MCKPDVRHAQLRSSEGANGWPATGADWGDGRLGEHSDDRGDAGKRDYRRRQPRGAAPDPVTVPQAQRWSGMMIDIRARTRSTVPDCAGFL